MTEQIQRLVNKFHNSNKMSKKRKALTSILKLGAVLHFNYVKLNNETKSYTIVYNPNYTYDIPPFDSDFIYLFDTESKIFKHFKLLRISDIEFTLEG